MTNQARKLIEIAVDPGTDGIRTCPKALEAELAAAGDPIFVQGAEVHDPELLGQARPGADEKLLALPRPVAMQLARHLLRDELP